MPRHAMNVSPSAFVAHARQSNLHPCQHSYSGALLAHLSILNSGHNKALID